MSFFSRSGSRGNRANQHQGSDHYKRQGHKKGIFAWIMGLLSGSQGYSRNSRANDRGGMGGRRSQRYRSGS